MRKLLFPDEIAKVEAQAEQQPRTVEEALANDPNYVIHEGRILLKRRNIAPAGKDLALLDANGRPVITYDGVDIHTALEQYWLARTLSKAGIRPTENIKHTCVVDSYANAGSDLLELAGRLRGVQEQMVTEGLRRGQQ